MQHSGYGLGEPQENLGVLLNEKFTEDSCSKDMAQLALNDLSHFYLLRYKQLFIMTQTRKATRISRWVNASLYNWFFGIWVSHSFLQKTPFTTTIITKEMMITRPTARKLISDCLGEGWLEEVKNGDGRVKGYIGVKGFYLSWERYLSHTIEISKFDTFYNSLKTYQFCLEKMEGNHQNMERPFP